MEQVVVIPAGGGELIGDSPERRVEILSDQAPLHATWSRFAAGRDGADLHVHREHADLFYVLQGQLTVRLGPAGEEVAVPAGTLAHVPPGVVHGFRNASDAELRYLNLHAPGVRFADYLRGLRDGRPISYDQYDPPPDGGRPPADATIGADQPLAGGVTLLAGVEAIAVAEVRWDGRDAPPWPPLDGRELTSVYVLEGELRVRAGGGELRAGPGAWLQLAAGLSTAASVAADGPVRYVAATTPAGEAVAGLVERG